MNSNNQQVAIFAGGCFWCLEAVFQRLQGVMQVVSGYASHNAEDHQPTYEQVTTGMTPFAEAVQITFDPTVISYQTLLGVFWAIHDPTTLNRQGADAGPQYRAVIFYHTQDQKDQAEHSKQKLAQSGTLSGSIVTAIEPFGSFFPAEEYHQNFYNQNKTYGYCRLVIDPKIKKLYKDFSKKVKPE